MSNTSTHTNKTSLLLAAVTDQKTVQHLQAGAEQLQHQLLTVTTETELIEVAHIHLPVLIFLDWSLFSENTLAVARHLRGHKMLSQTPISFLLSDAQLAARETLYTLPKVSYLLKPLIHNELLAHCRLHMEMGPAGDLLETAGSSAIPKQEARRLTIVNELAHVLHESLNLQTVAENTVRVLMQHTHAFSTGMYLLTAKNTLRNVYTFGVGQSAIDQVKEIPIENSISGHTVREKTVILSDDILSDARFSTQMLNLLTALNIRRIVSIPILHNQQILGVINSGFVNDVTLSPDFIEMLGAVGKTVGLAITNAQTIARLESEIQDRIHSEQALLESESRYAAVVNQAHDGVIIVQHNIICFANPAFAAISGYTIEELIGLKMQAILSPDSLNYVTQVHQSRMNRQAGPQFFEAKIIHKQGYPIKLEISGGMIEYYGQPASLALVRDVTERKRAEQTQRILYDISQATTEVDTLEALFATIRHKLTPLIDTTNFYVAIYDELKDHYEFPFVADESDLPPWSPEPLPNSLTDYVRRTGQPLLIDIEGHERLQKQGEAGMVGTVSPVWLGVPLKTKRGVIGTMVVQSYTDVYAYSKDDMHLLASIAENISWVIDAKQSEIALRESETRYRTLFEQSNDAILLHNMNGRVIAVNPRTVDMLETTEEEILGASIIRFSVQEEHRTVEDKWQTVLQKGQLSNYERPLVTAKGNRLSIEVSAVLIRDTTETPIYVLTVLRDITERTQARNALRESEERLQLALDSANEGMWDWDVTNNAPIHVSPRYYTLLGYEPNEFMITLDNWSKLIHPEDFPRVGNVVAIATQLQDRFYNEYRIRKKSGEYIWISDRGRVVERGEEGEPIRLIGTINDITARKESELALRESEETARQFQIKLRFLHEISLELFHVEQLEDLYRRAIELGRTKLGFDRLGLFLHDYENNLVQGTYGTDLNGRVRDETAYTRNIEDEPRIKEILSGAMRSKIWENHDLYDQWQPVGQGWLGVAVLWNGSGGIGYIFADNLLKQQPLRPYEADLLMIYGSTLGYVINRKLADIEIKSYVEQLQLLRDIDAGILRSESPQTLLSNIIDPLQTIIDCDYISIAVTNEETDTFTLINSVDPLNPIRKLPRSFIDLDVINVLAEGSPYMMSQIPADTTNLAEIGLLNQGFQSYLHLPLIFDKKLVGSITFCFNEPGNIAPDKLQIAQDIAAQLAIALRQTDLFEEVQIYANKLEQLVDARTAQLEEKARELESFTYSVSHDLRAPLRAIDGFSRLLDSKHNQDLPDSAQHYLNRIQYNAKRMGSLIDDLLDLSRVGRRALRWQTIHMTDLVQEIVNDLTADDQIGRAQITLEPLPTCQGDTILLRQALINLITNAIKYSSKQEDPQITIGHLTQDNRVTYFVRDNGVGFDMKYTDKLFGVFQRLHTLDEYEGTGIGLATVYRIIQRHNGHIWAYATPNNGATFYFTIGIPEPDAFPPSSSSQR